MSAFFCQHAGWVFIIFHFSLSDNICNNHHAVLLFCFKFGFIILTLANWFVFCIYCRLQFIYAACLVTFVLHEWILLDGRVWWYRGRGKQQPCKCCTKFEQYVNPVYGFLKQWIYNCCAFIAKLVCWNFAQKFSSSNPPAQKIWHSGTLYWCSH